MRRLIRMTGGCGDRFGCTVAAMVESASIQLGREQLESLAGKQGYQEARSVVPAKGPWPEPEHVARLSKWPAALKTRAGRCLVPATVGTGFWGVESEGRWPDSTLGDLGLPASSIATIEFSESALQTFLERCPQLRDHRTSCQPIGMRSGSTISRGRCSSSPGAG